MKTWHGIGLAVFLVVVLAGIGFATGIIKMGNAAPSTQQQQQTIQQSLATCPGLTTHNTDISLFDTAQPGTALTESAIVMFDKDGNGQFSRQEAIPGSGITGGTAAATPAGMKFEAVTSSASYWNTTIDGSMSCINPEDINGNAAAVGGLNVVQKDPTGILGLTTENCTMGTQGTCDVTLDFYGNATNTFYGNPDPKYDGSVEIPFNGTAGVYAMDRWTLTSGTQGVTCTKDAALRSNVFGKSLANLGANMGADKVGWSCAGFAAATGLQKHVILFLHIEAASGQNPASTGADDIGYGVFPKTQSFDGDTGLVRFDYDNKPAGTLITSNAYVRFTKSINVA